MKFSLKINQVFFEFDNEWCLSTLKHVEAQQLLVVFNTFSGRLIVKIKALHAIT
jgi:hypothetical protein